MDPITDVKRTEPQNFVTNRVNPSQQKMGMEAEAGPQMSPEAEPTAFGLSMLKLVSRIRT